MASGITFKPDFAGYRAVLDSGGVQAEVEKIAQDVASAASSMLDPDEGFVAEDFVVRSFTTKVGAKGRVVRTNTAHAAYSQNKNKTLRKALNSV